MNRRLTYLLAGLAALLSSATFVPVAGAGGALEPQPPDYLIEIVRGQPIYDLVFPTPPEDSEGVRIEVDGTPVLTDDFPPYADRIVTKRFDRLGISLETVHAFTVSAVPFFGDPVALAQYHLLIHPLPVIPRVHVYPLVLKGRTHLVGFQLLGIPRKAQVMAWGRGFRSTRGNYPLPLRRTKVGDSSRTYLVPGGLDWRRGSRPRLIFSIVPTDLETRGRIYTGLLKTDRAGNTRIHHIDDWDSCASYASNGHRPPRKVSCVYL
jgi:hypothetical protein